MTIHKPLDETMSGVIYHMLKRTEHVNKEGQLAIDKEDREWIV